MRAWRLKGGRVRDKLVGGEVAERLNAAVSKTVMSVIPASGVRIPPSPLREDSDPEGSVSRSLRLQCV